MTDQEEWTRQLVKTLRLRYDALTSGELSMYRELMVQRGIEVPEWFDHVKNAVDRQDKVRAPAYLAIPPDEKAPAPRYVEGRCTLCHTDTFVDSKAYPPRCYTCQELDDVRDRLAPRLAAYDEAVRATEFHSLAIAHRLLFKSGPVRGLLVFWLGFWAIYAVITAVAMIFS